MPETAQQLTMSLETHRNHYHYSDHYLSQVLPRQAVWRDQHTDAGCSIVYNPWTKRYQFTSRPILGDRRVAVTEAQFGERIGAFATRKEDGEVAVLVYNCDDEQPLAEGDEVEVDLGTGRIANKSRSAIFSSVPFPEFMRKIIDAGGLINRTKQELEGGS